MTKKITIYGASDDLIEVEGGINAEGSSRHGRPGYVVLDTGDVFSVEYTDERDGTWRVRHAVVSGRCSVTIEEAPESDVAIVEGPFEALCIYQSWPIDDEELKDLLEEAIEGAISRGRPHLPRAQLIAAIEAISGKPVLGAKP